MRHSMTGYASGDMTHGGLSWIWEVRGVNSKGLDLRFRLPDGVEGMDAELRPRLQARISRGAVTVSLKLQPAEAGAETVRLSETQLETVLDAMARIDAAAIDKGLSLAPSTAADIVALRGILDGPGAPEITDAVRGAMIAGFDKVLAAFEAARAGEGSALAEILSGQIARIEALVGAARGCLDGRRAEQKSRLSAQLARVMGDADAVDPDRVAQELALIAVKQDVAEELDRLDAHVAQARTLLVTEGPVGRKLDFLSQEFNREANTLCSKAQYAPLTEIGLELKTVIDQMREQVQNVE